VEGNFYLVDRQRAAGIALVSSCRKGIEMKVLVVGDSYMPTRYFQQAFGSLGPGHAVDYLQVDPALTFSPTTASELRIKEYQGSPAQLCAHMAGVEALVVQGAPVTDAVLDASSALKLVGCARGGPVNVDLEAVNARGLVLVNTPGKNAEAVADQTLAFLVMLARGFPRAQRFLEQGQQLKDNWEGAKFIGSDLRRHSLGLVGFGQVGQRVARRAIAFGMKVTAFDPYVDVIGDENVERLWALDDLLAQADFVSLHARATADNTNLFDDVTFAKMREGSYFVNTARETLVDEDALDGALASGRLAGAALDVVRPTTGAGQHRLLRHPNVVMTPHIGGATHETLLQGAEMVADELRRYTLGEPLRYVVNREAAVS
jgi:D-3-phosphoglycerate dehydrogenase / 2-oxoglutarate reductase